MSTPTKPTKTAAEIAAETANAELARTAAVAKATETTTVETPAKVDEPTDVKALSAAVAVLTAEVKALSASTTARERSEIIAQAAREGKQLPGEDTLKLLDNVQLRALSAGLPVTVPMEHRVPHADLVALSSPSAPVNDVISKHTGVTDEMRKKYGAA
jgi:phage I-like protein